MKVVILAGGRGTRISEESHLRPKPMIEIGGKPILWHIMKLYSHYGYNEFIICAGYKQQVIKEWLSGYYLYHSDVTFDLKENGVEVHSSYSEPWRVSVIDTGLNTMTGGRVKQIQRYVGDEPFLLTYGDGVSDINLAELVKFHRSHGKYCTVTATSVGQKFGVLDIDGGNQVIGFREKDDTDGSVVNMGFMVCEPQFFEYLEGDKVVLEREPLENLVRDHQLMAYRYGGFWQCMDTMQEKEMLEYLWENGKAPWRVWA